MGYCILSVDRLRTAGIELAQALEHFNPSIIEVKDEFEAEKALTTAGKNIDVIVWTINGADMQEFQAMRRINRKKGCENIPLIVISELSGKKYVINAIEAGAVEFIAKPYSRHTLEKKICRVLDIPLKVPVDKLDIEDIATFNFSEMYGKELKAAGRGRYPMSIIMAAIDRPTYEEGIEYAADNIAELACTVFRMNLRETDIVFKYSRKSIVILLPFADKAGAEVVKRKLADVFNSHSLLQQKGKGCTLHITSVTFPEDGKIKEKLMEKLESNIGGMGINW